jgi:hypothetical protein
MIIELYDWYQEWLFKLYDWYQEWLFKLYDWYQEWLLNYMIDINSKDSMEWSLDWTQAESFSLRRSFLTAKGQFESIMNIRLNLGSGEICQWFIKVDFVFLCVNSRYLQWDWPFSMGCEPNGSNSIQTLLIVPFTFSAHFDRKLGRGSWSYTRIRERLSRRSRDWPRQGTTVSEEFF